MKDVFDQWSSLASMDALSAFITSPGDVVLDHQDVVQWSVVGFRPKRYPLSAGINRASTRTLAPDFRTLPSSVSDTQRLGNIGDGYLWSPMRGRLYFARSAVREIAYEAGFNDPRHLPQRGLVLEFRRPGISSSERSRR
jgi:hypothetical protein